MFYHSLDFKTRFINLINECNILVSHLYNINCSFLFTKNKCYNHIYYYINLFIQELISTNIINTNEMIIINSNDNFEYRQHKTWCWFINALDGETYFNSRIEEFTINIGLTFNGNPVFGIISIPTVNTIYYGIHNIGSFKLLHHEITPLIIDTNKSFIQTNVKLIISSDLHNDTFKLIEMFNHPKIVKVGSTLKFIWIIEDKADIYVCLTKTSELTTCAATAIINAAGGKVLNYDTSGPIQYNKENLYNEFFITF